MKTNTMIKFESLIGIEELSKEIGLNKYTLYKKMRENKFPKGVKVNGRRLFKPESIKEYYQTIGVDITISESGN
jgi:predicted DNA-binding transcriptional regulator AlpA